MSFLQSVLSLDKTIEGINSILPIVSLWSISQQKGHEFKDCPKLKQPKEVPEQTIEFCIECMVPHPPGRCICRLCKTIGHTATECPWLEEAKATTKPPKTETENEEPEVLLCLHCR